MNYKGTLIATIGILLAATFSLRGQTSFKVKSNTMTVQGTSSLHDWESTITKAEWKGSFSINDNALTEIKDIEVKIPVESIKSTKGKMMDNKTYDAFHAEKFPYIIYTLGSASLNASTGVIDAKGKLTMAGVSQPIDLSVKYKVLSNGSLQITVTKTFKMTDFKMDPPTAMMGTIKVGDEVTVNFDLVLTTNKTI